MALRCTRNIHKIRDKKAQAKKSENFVMNSCHDMSQSIFEYYNWCV